MLQTVALPHQKWQTGLPQPSTFPQPHQNQQGHAAYTGTLWMPGSGTRRACISGSHRTETIRVLVRLQLSRNCIDKRHKCIPSFLWPLCQDWERYLFCLIHRNKQRGKQNEQRNVFQTWEQYKISRKGLNDIEINYLIKKSKIIVTKMLT